MYVATNCTNVKMHARRKKLHQCQSMHVATNCTNVKMHACYKKLHQCQCMHVATNCTNVNACTSQETALCCPYRHHSLAPHPAATHAFTAASQRVLHLLRNAEVLKSSSSSSSSSGNESSSSTRSSSISGSSSGKNSSIRKGTPKPTAAAAPQGELPPPEPLSMSHVATVVWACAGS